MFHQKITDEANRIIRASIAAVLQDAAGGMVTGEFYAAATAHRVSAHLDNNDAYPLLKELGALIMTGPTGTNVNDLYILLKR